jgi:apolipoprotein N-acyltransferase
MEASAEKDLVILGSHRHFTEELDHRDVDLVVWPESSVGIDPFRTPEVGEAVADSARAAGAPMIVGGNLERDDGRYQVMAYLVGADGTFVDRYQKTHLVPFGEYVPARHLLDWIPALDQVPRDAVPGGERTVFDVEGHPIAPVISFEGDFGSLVQDRIAAGGRLLVVPTNTSTWGDSWASAQHVAMSQVRAAENGVDVVHAALSGISAFIRADGSVIARTPLWTPTSLVEEVRLAESVTPYARMGDWFPILCLIVGPLWPLVAARSTRRARPATVSP